jgi:hypothetical protein
VIRRLALGRDDIQRLPDTYAQAVVSRAFADRYRSDRPGQPFLPNDLLQKDGSWVCLRNSAVRPLAITHFESFAGRSAFLVFMRLPQGRQATLDYLKRLQDHGNSWTPALRAPGQPLPDPRPPQFPAGTAVALARRAMVVDNQGDLVPTPLMETVQFRVYRSILAGHPGQDFYEFKLERSRLFSADRAGLQPLPRDAREFMLFMAQGFDPFEVRPGSRPAGARPDPVFDRCDGCHQQPGIHSVMSYRQSELLSESSPEEETSVNAYAKRRRYDWGLLQGIWQSAAGEGGAE